MDGTYARSRSSSGREGQRRRKAGIEGGRNRCGNCRCCCAARAAAVVRLDPEMNASWWACWIQKSSGRWCVECRVRCVVYGDARSGRWGICWIEFGELRSMDGLDWLAGWLWTDRYKYYGAESAVGRSWNATTMSGHFR